MAKSAATGDPLAIKFHAQASNRDISFEVLKKLVNKVSRQYLVAPPAGMTDAQVICLHCTAAGSGPCGVSWCLCCSWWDVLCWSPTSATRLLHESWYVACHVCRTLSLAEVLCVLLTGEV